MQEDERGRVRIAESLLKRGGLVEPESAPPTSKPKWDKVSEGIYNKAEDTSMEVSAPGTGNRQDQTTSGAGGPRELDFSILIGFASNG